MSDMTIDIIAQEPYGRAALAKLKPTSENFRLYCVEWLGGKPGAREVLKVDGAEFRVAKGGPNKGRLSIIVTGTKRTTYLGVREIQEDSGAEVKL